MLEMFIVSLLAGLATALGGLIVIYVRKIGQRTLGFGLGFSSGVMIIIAFLSLFFKAVQFGTYQLAVISFMAGALLMMALDFFVPHQYFIKEARFEKESRLRFLRVGMMVAIGMTLHNFPEGAIVGIGYTVLPAFGIVLAIAIAVHNIPEGVAIALPLRASGMKKSKTFLITLASGLVEPFGALFSVLFLSAVSGIVPIALAFTAGVMVYLVVDELIPLANKECDMHSISIGIIFGMGLAFILETLVM
jgi:ZIP family zinc transporter